MADLRSYRSGGFNLDLLVAWDYQEPEDEDDNRDPVLVLDFAAPSLNATNQPGGSLYRLTYHGQEAREVYKNCICERAIPIKGKLNRKPPT